MKHKLTALLFCLCMLLTMLVGCGGSDSGQGDTASAPTPAPTPTVTPVPTPEPPKGIMYLTVSRITFSVVGESENVWCGTLPLELVTWESADESVITVENGVLTAVGVGTTTVTCEYNGEKLECEAGCLAANEEELQKLGEKVLRSPKRYPAQAPEGTVTWYDDAAIAGDSITYVLWQWETKLDVLGNVTFFVRGGTSLNGFNRNYKNIYYKGVETPFESIVAQSGVEKLFIMMGQTDLRTSDIDGTMASWDILLERVKEKSPDVEIYIQSLTPENTKTYGKNTNNERIVEYNEVLKQYCEENGYHWVEIAPYVVDHTGRMVASYASDEVHLNEQGCRVWLMVLKNYAFLQENQGE